MRQPTAAGGVAAEGSDGRIVRGNFPAPTLKTKIDEGNATRKIKKLAGQAFTRLFVPTISYRPIEKFREAATVLLPKSKHACVLWRTKTSCSSPKY